MKYSFGLSISIMYSVIITMHSHYLQASEPRESPKSTVRSVGMTRVPFLKPVGSSSMTAYLNKIGDCGRIKVFSQIEFGPLSFND